MNEILKVKTVSVVCIFLNFKVYSNLCYFVFRRSQPI